MKQHILAVKGTQVKFIITGNVIMNFHWQCAAQTHFKNMSVRQVTDSKKRERIKGFPTSYKKTVFLLHWL